MKGFLAAVFLAAMAISESAAFKPAEIPGPIRDAVAASDRPDADKALDAGRQPAQMLAFFGISPNMKVADLWAGGGYTTELLARVVGAGGKVYSQEPIFPPELKQIEDAWTRRVASPALVHVVIPVHQNTSDADFQLAPDGSLDAVVVNMNYHDWVLQKLDREKINAIVLRALRPGGVYGIVDHAAKPGAGDESLQLHRINEDFLIAEVEKAGFKLAGASAALRNPADDHSWSTSPRVAGEKRGTSDRFMLRFVKP
ncbi:MAG TPA: SAM-dependent methyltransferase [Myxococcota bacterium]|nr:SAM-dependent methyltransferase [Myxococcota bacterium]